MTVPIQIPVTASTANGVTTVFPYGFMIADEEDLAVTVDGALQTSGYTVSGVGNPSGGDVTFDVAPANGEKVVRFLAPVLKREENYTQFGDWMAAIVNLDFDRVWLALQAQQQDILRSLKLPVDTSTDQTLVDDATARVGKSIKFDVSGNLILTDFDPDEAQTLAAASASAAATSESNAATSATNAASSASAAASSASAASTSATNASASATAAQAAADAVMWNDVVFKTFADSPITITNADTGKLFAIDCSGGAVTVNLPQISALTLSTPWSIGFKKTESSANAVTINRAGTDTIDGATSLSISSIQGRVLVPDTDPAPDTWTSMQFGADALADGAVTTAKIADGAATAAKLATSAKQQIQPISASVAANALTISASELSLDFRSTTLGSGAVTRVTGTPANLVISSGSTMGTVNAVQSRIAVLALNNAGTIELAAVNTAGAINLDESGVISTTAEGGAGAADSISTIYSTTARTNVAYRVIGYVESTQATAGTWATAPSTIQGAGGNAMQGMMTLGHGQTFQSVAGSRTSGTTYYNTTGRPISVFATAGGGGGAFSIAVNGATVCNVTPGYAASGFAIVPPGASYVITYAALTALYELR